MRSGSCPRSGGWLVRRVTVSKLTTDQHLRLLERAKRKLQSAQSDQTHNTNLPEAISLLLDIRHSTAYRAVNANTDATPTVSPPTLDFGHLPAWAIQPALGEIHDWWDLPANLFGTGYENDQGV